MYSFLSLGDSYTCGEAVHYDGSWPAILAKNLHGQLGLQIQPTVLATTGWTTDELFAAIPEQSFPNNFVFSTLLIGVNNQYRGYPIENYRAEFSTLLNLAVSFAANDPLRTLVVSIPDWGITPFASDRDAIQIGQEIDLYNQIAHEICQKQQVKFIDITTVSRQVSADPAYLAPDGLHPSAKQYHLWAAEILPSVQFILERQTLL